MIGWPWVWIQKQSLCIRKRKVGCVQIPFSLHLQMEESLMLGYVSLWIEESSIHLQALHFSMWCCPGEEILVYLGKKIYVHCCALLYQHSIIETVFRNYPWWFSWFSTWMAGLRNSSSKLLSLSWLRHRELVVVCKIYVQIEEILITSAIGPKVLCFVVRL